MAEQTFYVLVCRECSPLLPMPFGSAAERGKWAAEHTRATGHDHWFVTDERRPVADVTAPGVPGFTVPRK